MKKAIVTGATGFIGSTFVEYLSLQGIEVIALGRKPFHMISPSRQNKLQGAKYLNLNMNDISLLEKYLINLDWTTGKDCVFFNLAWGGENFLSDLNEAAQLKNVVWSVSALEIAHKVGCDRFIQIGTMEEAFTKEYLELDHHLNSQYNRHVIYSVAKMAAKISLEVRAAQLRINLNYVLHSHVMGPDDDKDSFLQVTLKKLKFGDELIFSTGEQYFDVISLKDCCIGYYLICQKGRPGETYWVGSGDPQRLRDYVERMYRLYPSDKEMQFGKLPYNDIILDKEIFSIANLVKDTGYFPTMTYEETVSELYAYLF